MLTHSVAHTECMKLKHLSIATSPNLFFITKCIHGTKTQHDLDTDTRVFQENWIFNTYANAQVTAYHIMHSWNSSMWAKKLTSSSTIARSLYLWNYTECILYSSGEWMNIKHWIRAASRRFLVQISVQNVSQILNVCTKQTQKCQKLTH